MDDITITVSGMPKELLAEIDKRAKANQRSRAAEIRVMLALAVEKREMKKAA